MTNVKEIAFDDPEGNATGTHIDVLRNPDELRIGDVAELLCKGVIVLVKVTTIEADDVTGTVQSLENYDEENLDGVAQGDKVTFKLQKVHGWL